MIPVGRYDIDIRGDGSLGALREYVRYTPVLCSPEEIGMEGGTVQNNAYDPLVLWVEGLTDLEEPSSNDKPTESLIAEHKDTNPSSEPNQLIPSQPASSPIQSKHQSFEYRVTITIDGVQCLSKVYSCTEEFDFLGLRKELLPEILPETEEIINQQEEGKEDGDEGNIQPETAQTTDSSDHNLPSPEPQPIILRRNTGKFVLRVQNKWVHFADSQGSGFTKLLSYRRKFYVREDRKSHLEAELVACFYDLDKKSTLLPFACRDKLMELFGEHFSKLSSLSAKDVALAKKEPGVVILPKDHLRPLSEIYDIAVFEQAMEELHFLYRMVLEPNMELFRNNVQLKETLQALHPECPNCLENIPNFFSLLSPSPKITNFLYPPLYNINDISSIVNALLSTLAKDSSILSAIRSSNNLCAMRDRQYLLQAEYENIGKISGGDWPNAHWWRWLSKGIRWAIEIHSKFILDNISLGRNIKLEGKFKADKDSERKKSIDEKKPKFNPIEIGQKITTFDDIPKRIVNKEVIENNPNKVDTKSEGKIVETQPTPKKDATPSLPPPQPSLPQPPQPTPSPDPSSTPTHPSPSSQPPPLAQRWESRQALSSSLSKPADEWTEKLPNGYNLAVAENTISVCGENGEVRKFNFAEFDPNDAMVIGRFLYVLAKRCTLFDNSDGLLQVDVGSLVNPGGNPAMRMLLPYYSISRPAVSFANEHVLIVHRKNDSREKIISIVRTGLDIDSSEPTLMMSITLAQLHRMAKDKFEQRYRGENISDEVLLDGRVKVQLDLPRFIVTFLPEDGPYFLMMILCELMPSEVTSKGPPRVNIIAAQVFHLPPSYSRPNITNAGHFSWLLVCKGWLWFFKATRTKLIGGRVYYARKGWLGWISRNGLLTDEIEAFSNHKRRIVFLTKKSEKYDFDSLRVVVGKIKNI